MQTKWFYWSREGVQVELNKKIEKKETKEQSKEQLTVTDPHPEEQNIFKYH